MQCTVRELFNLIVQDRNDIDFYQEGTGLEVEDYLSFIMKFTPKEKRILTACCQGEPLSGADGEIGAGEIDAGGLLLYYFVLHDDEFSFIKIENYDELYDKMRRYLTNYFIGDLVIFENGKKKNYCVRNKQGEILHSSFGQKLKEDEFIIEWY